MSSVGLASGIDTNSIVEQLMSIERRPVNKLKTKLSNKEKLLSYYSDLRSKLTSLQTAVSGMKSVSSFAKVTAATSDEDIATVSASGDAAIGKHVLKVSQLATNAVGVSQGFATKSSTIGTGTIKLNVGDEDYEIEMTSSNNTLTGLKDAINALGADVTASIVNTGDDSTPYRLVITSTETGEEGAHTLTYEDWTGTQLNLTYGEDGGAGQAAKNSLFTLDGMQVEKSSNAVDDLLDGVTIYLNDDSEPTQAVTITMSSNTEEIVKSIQTFVDSYNAVVDYVDGLKNNDAVKNDSTFSQMNSVLRSVLNGGASNANGIYKTLSQVGVTSEDGKLTIDNDTLTDALEDHFSDVVALFATEAETTSPYVSYEYSTTNTVAGDYAVNITGVGSSFGGTIGGYAANPTSGNYLVGATGTPVEGMMIQFTGTTAGSYGTVDFSVGIMESFERTLKDYLNTTDGILETREDRINESIDDLEAEIEKKELSLDTIEANMRARFVAMEMAIQKLQTMQSQLSSISNSSLY